MNSSFVHKVNFVDSAARRELKLVPEEKVDWNLGVVKSIIERLKEIDIIKYRPISIVTKEDRNCIWIHYPEGDREDIVNYLSTFFNDWNPTILCVNSKGGMRYFLKIQHGQFFTHLEIKLPGVGEKRLYLGSTTSDLGQEIVNNFSLLGRKVMCVLKLDLEVYLRDSQNEFVFPSQNYYDQKITDVYKENLVFLKTLENENYGEFSLTVDSQKRIYIKDSNVGSLAVLKLINRFCIPLKTQIEFVFDQVDKVLYVRPRYSDNTVRILKNKKYINSKLYKSRNGLSSLGVEELDLNFDPLVDSSCQRDYIKQSKFRRELVDEQGECIITSVRIESAIEAAHIKPFSVCCQEGLDSLLYDSINGVLLRRDLHSLYDVGLITFRVSNDRVFLLLSSSISNRDRMKLGIVDGLELRCSRVRDRSELFRWHNEYVFKQ